MEIADASLAVIPRDGKSAGGHTLAEFADAVDVGYSRLNTWRTIWKWCGRDLPAVGQIPSLAVAEEAMNSGRWPTAKSFIRMMEKDPTPTIAREGYEPHTFEGWTRAVLRAYLGRPLTAEQQLVMRAIETGKDPDRDEVIAAEIGDRADAITESLDEIEDAGTTAWAADRLHKASRASTGKAAAKVDTYAPSEDEMGVLSFRDTLRKLGASDLPRHIMEATWKLCGLLEDVDDFRAKFGDVVVEGDPSKGEEPSFTLGELLEDVLEREAGRTQIAFAAAIGAPDVPDGVS